MTKRSGASSFSSAQAAPMITKERQALMFKGSVVAERSVSTHDFSKFNFEGHTIHQSFTHDGWKRVLCWIGSLYTILVQELYAVLQEVDTNEIEWGILIRGVTIRISPNIISRHLGIPRQVGAYLAVEHAVALSTKEIFRLMNGEE